MSQVDSGGTAPVIQPSSHCVNVFVLSASSQSPEGQVKVPLTRKLPLTSWADVVSLVSVHAV